MIDFTINNKKYHIPGAWEELTALQYENIIHLYGKYTDINECRIMAALVLTGLMPRRFRKQEIEQLFNENIYRISREIKFMFRIEYVNKKTFSRLKKDAREALYRFLPSELDTTIPEFRWAMKQKFTLIPDLVFAKNLIPFIKSRRNKMNGYTFDLDGRILTSSLSFIQFVDAQQLSTHLLEHPTEALYDRLIAILYYPGKYDPDKVDALTIPRLSIATKQAILFNFNAIQAFLYTRTRYRILFSSPSVKSSSKNSGLGLIGAGYSLTKSGYGDMDDKPLLKVFNIMYAELVSTVKELKSAGLSIADISEKTNITLNIINQIL